jgi:hypothetical protein
MSPFVYVFGAILLGLLAYYLYSRRSTPANPTSEPDPSPGEVAARESAYRADTTQGTGPLPSRTLSPHSPVSSRGTVSSRSRGTSYRETPQRQAVDDTPFVAPVDLLAVPDVRVSSLETVHLPQSAPAPPPVDQNANGIPDTDELPIPQVVTHVGDFGGSLQGGNGAGASGSWAPTSPDPTPAATPHQTHDYGYNHTPAHTHTAPSTPSYEAPSHSSYSGHSSHSDHSYGGSSHSSDSGSSWSSDSGSSSSCDSGGGGCD